MSWTKIGTLGGASNAQITDLSNRVTALETGGSGSTVYEYMGVY